MLFFNINLKELGLIDSIFFKLSEILVSEKNPCIFSLPLVNFTAENDGCIIWISAIWEIGPCTFNKSLTPINLTKSDRKSRNRSGCWAASQVWLGMGGQWIGLQGSWIWFQNCPKSIGDKHFFEKGNLFLKDKTYKKLSIFICHQYFFFWIFPCFVIAGHIFIYIDIVMWHDNSCTWNPLT